MTAIPAVRSVVTPAVLTRPVTVTIILPSYNEASALPTVLADVIAIAQTATAVHYEIIVVDDGSTDDSLTIARKFPVRVIRHRYNRGKGAAIRSGLTQATGDLIVVMDADATYPASAIPRLVELLAHYDLVRCSRPRNTETMPLINRVGNRMFDLLLSFSHGLDGSDHLSGLYGLRREAVLRMRLESEGFDIEAEIGIKARVRGLRTAAFPIEYGERLGEKKLHAWKDGFLILGRILAMLLLYNPLITFVVPGFIIMLLALGGAAVLGQGAFWGLDVHAFIIVVLGSVASFQLIVFGVAAALYGVESGYRPARWLVRLSSRPVRLGSALLGVLTGIFATGYIITLFNQWVADGTGLFFATRQVVLASTALVFGMQLVSAALFLSIFAGRLQRIQKAPPVEIITPFDADE
ncbi:MAG: glycosyltransferase family 2 protein [Anaerolineales bacterium]